MSTIPAVDRRPFDGPRPADLTRPGPAPLSAPLRLGRWMWERLPAWCTSTPVARSYGRVVHALIRARATRQQCFGTFFFRNRPQLEVVRRLTDRKGACATLRIAFLGCSHGAEAYSILWTIRSRRPDLNVIAHAVDISYEILDAAQRAVYALTAEESGGQRIFARIRDREMCEMFDVDSRTGTARLRAAIKDGIRWHHADAGSRDLPERVGPQDIVVANNFLCHMDPSEADACLRNIARVVKPGGHLLVSGVDLDVRARVAAELGWKPVRDLLEDVHEGDPAVRRDWPWKYWGLEPLDRTRPGHDLRYASVFEVGARA